VEAGRVFVLIENSKIQLFGSGRSATQNIFGLPTQRLFFVDFYQKFQSKFSNQKIGKFIKI